MNKSLIVTLLLLYIPGLAAPVPAQLPPSQEYAVQLRDGTTAFTSQPRLLSVTTTNNNTRSWSAAYYFTIELPADASEPLKTIQIEQTQGFNIPRYNWEKTTIFTGHRRNRGAVFAIESASISDRTITLVLDDPIPPGTTFTVKLSPIRNPRTSGVYLFRVATFPAGENPQPAILRVGRLHFYSPYPYY